MSDEEWRKRLNNPGYKNWIKVSLALIKSKEALHDFTEKTIIAIHNDIKTKVGSGICTGTSLCNTRKGGGPTGKEPSCPNCAQWVTEIKRIRNGQLYWKNADPKIWHNAPWEIAKCFMNAQGSKATAASVTGPDKTDLSGILNVLIGCKEFGHNHLNNKKLPEQVREVRNDLMHCATMSFTNAEMQNMVNKVIALLEDEKELKHEKICHDKVKVIKSIRDSDFELKSDDEEICIQTALETHELAFVSGEEIDENMKSLHETIITLIKGNKHLEKKFDDKLKKSNEEITNIKQECDAKFLKYDVIIGKLKGKIESLEKNQASGQSCSSSSTSSIFGNEIKSFYKNALQSYAQKKKLDSPRYETIETKEKRFVSIVYFEGNEFKSIEPKPSKKEAEQNAAEQALIFIGNKDVEVSNEKDDFTSVDPQVMGSNLTSQQIDKNYKNLLQEIAQKKKIPNPIYNSRKTESGFLSEVMYDGQWYSPDISPQNKKVDAEQKAASFVLAYLDREDTSNSSSPSQSDDAYKVDRKEEITAKQCRVILNEHIQKMTKGELPEYKTEKNSDGKFVCSVIVFGKVYKSPLGMNSVSEAKESAALEACKDHHLVDAIPASSSRSAVKLSLEKEDSPVIDSPCNETDAISQVTSLTKATNSEASTSNDRPFSPDRSDGKTCISLLQEYAQKMGAENPQYSFLGPDEDNCFRSKVIVLEKVFDCTESYPTKKAAKQMAANEALKYFNGLSEESLSVPKSEGNTVVVSRPPDSNELPSNTTPAISAVPSAAEISAEAVEPRLEQSFDVGAVKPSSETSVSNNSDGQQIPTTKINPNAKNALLQYAQKAKLDQCLRYESQQNPATKEFWSKVFLGKRCFKGKEPKTKQKEAEKHVAELALNTLQGRGDKPSDKPDRDCKELLSKYHKDHGFPSFPKYKETSCNQGKFSVECKVKKKYEYVCNDRKSKKKDVEMTLAEQAVKELEETNKMTSAEGNVKSRLNHFLQSQDGHDGESKAKYEFQGDQAAYTGSVCFFADDVYESLLPQQTKDEAITSAAVSACNGMNLH